LADTGPAVGAADAGLMAGAADAHAVRARGARIAGPGLGLALARPVGVDRRMRRLRQHRGVEAEAGRGREGHRLTRQVAVASVIAYRYGPRLASHAGAAGGPSFHRAPGAARRDPLPSRCPRTWSPPRPRRTSGISG